MRHFVLGAIASIWAATSFAAAPGGTLSPLSGRFVSGELPDFDASRQGVATAAVDAMAPARASRSRFGFPSHVDLRLGTTFLWADPSQRQASLAAPAAPSDALGRAHLRRNARALGLGPAAISQAHLHEMRATELGAVLYRYEQRQGGFEVFGRALTVMTDARGRLVAISGGFAPQADQAAMPTFRVPATDAVRRAFRDLGGDASVALRAVPARDGYERFQAAPHAGDLQMTGTPRAKRVLFPLAGALVPAWYVEVTGRSRDLARQVGFGYVVSAADGRVLFRRNQVDHDTAFTYNVLASRKGSLYDSPLGNDAQPFRQASPYDPDPRTMAPARHVTLATSMTGKGTPRDPWLADGATTTSGNNVVSYLDLGGADGFDAGDLMPAVTSANTFDYPVGGALLPTDPAVRSGAAVHLFFANNSLHDAWYGAGFDEVSGNAQQSNYGRGGVEGDPMHAEGQDSGGRNNANMYTPADGTSPRMQMYLWDGLKDAEATITAPAELAGSLVFGTALFGPQGFDVTGDVVLLDDGVAPSSDGCTAAVNGTALAGKLALIDRGTCAFTVKVKTAQDAGAIGVVIANNVAGTPPNMSGTDATITIPSMSVSLDDGNRIKASSSTVTMHLRRAVVPDIDGTIDTDIIAHEYFHHVSNRLVGNAIGLTSQQGRGMGEGWSDFAALLIQAREGDTAKPGNDHWQGAYSIGGFVGGNNYFGIRRAPYSTDFAKNPLTFQHIQYGVPLPTTAPLAFGQDGLNNYEVHNTGEIWCNVLWEAYVGFLNDGRYTHTQARKRMQAYVIAGLKMTPMAPTFLEARDAILSTADATDDADFMVWATAFAKRGMGVGAVDGDRNDIGNRGVVESYVVATPTP